MHTPEYPDTAYDRMARQLAGEASASERLEFERWLASDSAARDEFEAVSASWRGSVSRGAVDVDAAWIKLRNNLDRSTSRDLSLSTRRRTRSETRWWRSTGGFLQAAAVGLVVLGGAWLGTRKRGDAPEGATFSASPVVALTKVAERSQVRLPDGTEVVLGASSSLRTVEGYGASAREVELVGEAAFHVIHDERRPFRVRTSGATIEDLGTRFVVRAMGAEPVRVAVSEGSVSVSPNGGSAGRQVVLQPRDMALIGDSVDVSRGVDVEAYSAWTTGRLVFPFRGETLRRAIPELERWYDVDFEVSDVDLLSRTFSVTFDGDTIDEVLEVLGTTLGARFVRDGRVVRVAPAVRSELTPGAGMQVGGGA